MSKAVGNGLAETISRESRYPGITVEACVHDRFPGAECSACVAACPRDAWVLDEERLGLDTEACDGCGLCMAACPTGALFIHLPWVVRLLGGNRVALFTCDHSGLEIKEGILPCLHALGLRQLLLLYNAGIHYLLTSCGDCTTCDRNRGEPLQQRLEKLNRLLRERHHAPMKLLEHPAKVWMKLYRSTELIPRGTRLGRREFLRGNTAHLRAQLVVLDPLNLPEYRTLPPGELLPGSSAGGTGFHWPVVPAVDERLCNGCDVCSRLCPTGAIELMKEQDALYYHIAPRKCDGCGLCISACEPGAISIRHWAAADQERVELHSHRCEACGTPFHEPGGSDEKYCRICRTHDHAARLFQILE
jgi:ferredoxin